VHERIDRAGQVLTSLDPAEVVRAARELVEGEQAEVLAVSFLWSFRNPAHERAAVDALNKALPHVTVVAGSLVNPVMRDYERMTFALLNAYSMGAFSGVERLEAELGRLGLTAPLLLVDCSGGVTTVAGARELPISLVHSGPSGGVAASASVAASRKLEDVVCCDMGGTSFDISLVTGGRPTRKTRGELFGVMTALPTVDVESIGAGGGSIGWIDARGVLRVGPRSAGSTPGPACYGRGGTEPTITDALVVLGYIDPSSFLGGRMQLDASASVDACAKLGEQLGLSATEIAWGIREIALNSTVRATRMVLAARGLSSEGQKIVSYGGCGSLFTAELAAKLRIDKVLVPEVASVFSAYGAVSAELRRERAQSITMAAPFDVAEIARVADELAGAVGRDLEADGIPAEAQVLTLLADLRFRGQVSELSIPLASTEIDEVVLDALVQEFTAEYSRRFGDGALVLSAGLELATLRAVASAPVGEQGLASGPQDLPRFSAQPDGTRPVTLGRGDGPTDVAVYLLEGLRPGARLNGPACVDGKDTTIWVPDDATAELESDGSLVVLLGGNR
jgi:N-methylhydantoinase A